MNQDRVKPSEKTSEKDMELMKARTMTSLGGQRQSLAVFGICEAG
jgi:hypothetical protein